MRRGVRGCWGDAMDRRRVAAAMQQIISHEVGWYAVVVTAALALAWIYQLS